MTARCALPELLRLMEKDRVAQGIKKHYPGGKDHDQSNHGRARWTPDVPPSSQRERFAVSSDRWKSIEGISPFEEELPKAIKDWIGLGTYKGGDMSAFSGYRLSGPVTVFRGERAVAQGGKPRELSSYEVGDTVTFDGPTSTSLSPAVAVDFAFGGDKVGNLYEIDLPRGAKALGVTPKDKMGGDVSTLSEVIVEPMSFTVTGVREEQVYIHPNLPQYKATIYTLEPTREDLAKLVRLAKHPGPHRMFIAESIKGRTVKKHYPGGKDHDQSKHGKKGSGPRGVPKTGKRTTFTQITKENYQDLRPLWGTFERSVRVSANDSYVDISVFFGEDVAEADAFLALFPKFVKARKSNLSTSKGDYSANDGSYRHYTIYGVGFQATLKADGVNGGVNETGIKRLNKFIEVFRANDPGFTGWVMNGSTTNPMED